MLYNEKVLAKCVGTRTAFAVNFTRTESVYQMTKVIAIRRKKQYAVVRNAVTGETPTNLQQMREEDHHEKIYRCDSDSHLDSCLRR